MWDEITYPLPNFSGGAVEAWDWLSNFTPHIIMDVITFPFWDESQAMVVKGNAFTCHDVLMALFASSNNLVRRCKMRVLWEPCLYRGLGFTRISINLGLPAWVLIKLPWFEVRQQHVCVAQGLRSGSSTCIAIVTHYCDVMMVTIAFQITSLTIVY